MKIKLKFILIVLYSTILFFIGIITQRSGVIGLVIKPYIYDLFEQNSNKYNPLISIPQELHINLTQKSSEAIQNQNNLAISIGRGYRVDKKNTKYVAGTFLKNNKEIPLKLRVKGGMPFHHKNPDNKISLKIKIKNNSFLGMKKFAISYPGARHFLNEWVFHKFNNYLGLIYLRFGFVDVYFNNNNNNNKSNGIYCYEENISKQLIENNNRQEGVIISFNADFVWKKNQGIDVFPHLNDMFNKSDIKIYNQKRILNDSILRLQFNEARNLLEKFRNKELITSEVFDIEKLATFFSLVDLFGDKHGIGLWNLKFYFNPLNSKLEPVPYDQTYIESHNIVIAEKFKHSYYEQSSFFLTSIFDDQLFYKEYVKALKRISKKEFLDTFFNTIDNELKSTLNILHKEYPKYNFLNQKKVLYHNQAYIKQFISPIECLHSYFNSYNKKENCIKLEICNYFNLPIEISSIYINNEKISDLPSKIILKAHKNNTMLYGSVIKFKLNNNKFNENDIKNIKVKYNVYGLDNSIFTNIISWKRKNTITNTANTKLKN